MAEVYRDSMNCIDGKMEKKIETKKNFKRVYQHTTYLHQQFTLRHLTQNL